MKNFLLLNFVLFISLSVFAGFVPRKEAEIVAKNHAYQSVLSFKSLSWEDIKLNCIFDPAENDIHKFYVFNINGDQGYVVVSSDNQLKPILAYSFEGGFNFYDMSPGQAEFLKYFDESIEYAWNNVIASGEKAYDEWQELLNFTPTKDFSLKSTSPILLENINWNQDWPYNSQCPSDPDATYGMNGHVPVGCVATAMLQVMKYYNWPASGSGSKYHANFANGGYGNITINFAQQTYDWYSIPDKASTIVNTELGKINFHAGVAVAMYWGPDGSGSGTQNIKTALTTYFKYSSAIQYVKKSSYTDANWKSLIKQQIDDKMPVVYAGNPTSGAGHAWNCDGYQDDSFHMNWGWGGAGNGYYTLDNLISTATSGGEENNFNKNNEMIINIYPTGVYPPHCQGTKVITGSEGSFDDGSGSDNYEANQSCVYVIKPTCGSVVEIRFPMFDLADGDIVELFDGDQTSSELIASFDINNSPGSQTFASEKGALTIRFNTNSSLQANGWKASYSVKNCKVNTLFSAPSDSFGDGSKTCDYNNSTVCTWRIEPEGATYININFTKFSIADNSDYVKIYKDAIKTANLIGSFNKDNAPSGTIHVSSGVAYVQFITNSNTVADGFDLTYTSNATDIENNILLSEFSVMPNPGNLDSRLVFSLSDNSNTKIFVTNLLGEIIAMKDFKLSTGVHEIYLNEIINILPNSGIYFINVDSGKEIRTQKFVVF